MEQRATWTEVDSTMSVDDVDRLFAAFLIIEDARSEPQS